MKLMKIYKWLFVVLLVILGFFVFFLKNNKSGKLDKFVACLKDKKVTFYGAFWCPHCQNEKAFFGESAKLLPYVECSTPDGSSQLPICKQNKIESYPTWEFSDKSRLTGEVTLLQLAKKTGCALPKIIQ